MGQDILFILCVIGAAYVFDFINGFHDAANSIATIVTTGVLTPRQAVLWAAGFNFIAFLFFNMTVAKTIGSELIDTNAINPSLIFAALLAAISWGLITWFYGLPTSSSQALIGGLVGAAMFHGGWITIKWLGFIKIAVGIFIAPIVGLIASMMLTYVLTHSFRNKNKQSVNRLFKSLQLVSSACLSITHGANDAQKTMGIITTLLFSVSWLKGAFHVPLWIIISCSFMMSLGTLMGGWRIVHTMGTKITHLNTLRGCSAETGAALAIFAATEYGVPVSTTQTVTGAIAGAGLLNGMKKTFWPMLRLIFLSWLLTMPVTAFMAALIMRIMG
ncbi:MAG: inorganic phosphate transporter [Legionellaceae bacterium]|nr:inorganic phosphate transporter [Legionellaceae bacterium]